MTIIVTFVVFLIIFTLIGLASLIKNKHTNADYLIAGRSVKPWLVALSAVATNNSGYMFAGMIGQTYAFGLSSMWIMIGWIFGDFVASLFIHKRLRLSSEKSKVLSFPGAISSWGGRDYKLLRSLAGIATIIFLGTYAAAQLNAGSKALHVLFNWDYAIGAIIGAVIVVAYCMAGGIRASIWTDAAQSFVMFIAMLSLVVVSIINVGGWSHFISSLNQISPTYMNIFPDNLVIGGFTGPLLFVVGWIFAGFGVAGQPHIMIRFIAMDRPEDMKRVRMYYYPWYISFSALAIMVGLASRLILPHVHMVENFDAELALPILSLKLLPEILVGLVLAGLFAATISTADSQILSCSASLTSDFHFGKKVSYWITKLSTILVTIVALIIAIYGSSSVFVLVLIAWSALGALFVPLITVYALGGNPPQSVSIVMMALGLLVTLIWHYLGLGNILLDIAPGILAGFVPYLIYRVSKKVVVKEQV